MALTKAAIQLTGKTMMKKKERYRDICEREEHERYVINIRFRTIVTKNLNHLRRIFITSNEHKKQPAALEVQAPALPSAVLPREVPLAIRRFRKMILMQ